MTRLPLYQVDAFAERPFVGNPAAVCPLDAWLPDALMQSIALENNLSETAFFVRRPGTPGDDPGENTGDDAGRPEYDLRWFTPSAEVDLCGHATLASAKVVLDRLEPDAAAVRFHTRSGPLDVEARPAGLAMDLPAMVPAPAPDSESGEPGQALARALGVRPEALLRASWYWLVVLPSEAAVRAVAPDFRALADLGIEAIVTAPGDPPGVDFVSRMFAPALGVDEDPVTGSAHCTLTPYWAARLGRDVLRARQVSARGGEVACELRGDRVVLAGPAVLVLEGHLLLDGVPRA